MPGRKDARLKQTGSAQSSGGIATSGYIETLIQIGGAGGSPPEGHLIKQVIIGAIPIASPAYIKRGLASLSTFPATPDRPSILVLVGPSGAGKSQVAAEIAREAVSAGYQRIVWLATPSNQDWHGSIRDAAIEAGLSSKIDLSGDLLIPANADPAPRLIRSLSVRNSKAPPDI